MYFYNKIKKLSTNNELIIFVDMDGVIADYNFGHKLDFKNKRPIMTNINTLKEVSTLNNVKMCILSICKTENEVDVKNSWLDEKAPFFKKENRFIFSKECEYNLDSKTIKTNFLKKYENSDKKIIVIDDDNLILKTLKKEVKNIILFQDSSLID